jgi:hypothetical protein
VLTTFNFDSIKKAMKRREFVATMSVVEQTLRNDPDRMIFPITALLDETESDASIACYFHVTAPRLPITIARAALPSSEYFP